MRGSERHLFGGGALFQPIRNRLRILDRIGPPVLEPQNIFEQYLEADRQARDVAEALRRHRKREILIVPRSHGQRAPHLQAVFSNRRHRSESLTMMQS
jgi:hypothetical protein